MAITLSASCKGGDTQERVIAQTGRGYYEVDATAGTHIELEFVYLVFIEEGPKDLAEELIAEKMTGDPAKQPA